MKLAILTIILLLIAVVLLGVKVLFVKGAKFPSGHIGHSEAMRRRGIGCAAHSIKERNKYTINNKEKSIINS